RLGGQARIVRKHRRRRRSSGRARDDRSDPTGRTPRSSRRTSSDRQKTQAASAQLWSSPRRPERSYRPD
ncbi:hypothetical protein CTI14_72150, partial [Methylobacterium radiotolerans]